MEIKELICISCPLGCMVKVKTENGEIKDITGYSCKRGITYAQKEITNPVRIVTSTVKVDGGEKPLVSVKTKQSIPKSKIFDCMAEIRRTVVKAPVAAGDIIIGNVAGTGVDVVATKTVKSCCQANL
jgi:CxxC motif-containing protein